MFSGSFSDGKTTILLFDPTQELANCAALGVPPPGNLAKANALACPQGPEPARGWILVRRGDLDKLNLNNRCSLTMTVVDQARGINDTRTWQNLVVARETQVVIPGITPDDPLGVCLVELTDASYLCQATTFAQTINAQYNVRAQAYQGAVDDTTYDAASLNAGTHWTWQGMVTAIWGLMAPLGTDSTLPFAPNGIPEGFIFEAMPAYEALTAVLSRLACAIRRDLTQPAGSQFTICRIGEDDPDADAALASAVAANRKIFDAEFQPVVTSLLPYGTEVFFQRQEAYGGTEQVTGNTSAAWTSNDTYSVKTVGPYATLGAEPNIFTPILDDLPAIFAVNNTVTAASVTACAARAAERSADFYRMYGPGGSRLWQRFSGFLDIAAGSSLKGVRWLQTGEGAMTEIIRHPFLRIPLTDGGSWEAVIEDSDKLHSPDQRPMAPNYPPMPQVVELTGAAPTDGFYPANIQKYDAAGNAWLTEENVWALPLAANQRLGRLEGYQGGAPIYAIGSASDACLALTTSPITPRVGNQFGQGTAELQSIPGGLLTDAGVPSEIYSKFLTHAIPAGVLVTLNRDEGSGLLWVVEPDVQRRVRCNPYTLTLVAEWSVDGGNTWPLDPTLTIGCVPCTCGSSSGSDSGSGPCTTCVTIGGTGCAGSYCALPVGSLAWEVFVGTCVLSIYCSYSTPTGCACLQTTYSGMSVAFPGVTSDNCACTVWPAGVTLSYLTGGEYCAWGVNEAPCVMGGVTTQVSAGLTVQCSPIGQLITLSVQWTNPVFGGLPPQVTYVPAPGQLPWNGSSPLMMNLSTNSLALFGFPPCTPASWPATVTVYPGGSVVGGANCNCTMTVNGVIYTASAATCSPVGATFTSVDLSPCGCGGQTTVTIGGCGSASGSGSGGSPGSGSGSSGSGGGCSQTPTLVATGSTTGTSLTITVSGTVPAGSLLTVRVGSAATPVAASGTVTFAGNALNFQAGEGTSVVIGGTTFALEVLEYYIKVPTSVTSGSLVITFGVSGLILAVVTQVQPLSNYAPDSAAQSDGGGTTGATDIGFSSPTTHACEYSDAMFIVASASPPANGTWQNGYAATGAIQSGSLSGVYFGLYTADRTDIPIATSLDAAITGLTPLAWAGLQVPFN